MRMELIQPFINAADAVLATSLNAPTSIADVSMDEQTYRRKGLAALVSINGDIEGRVIFDLDEPTAAKVAAALAGGDVAGSPEILRDTIFELANQVIGNAVTSLNDQGFRFHISPPQEHTHDYGMAGSEDTEALVMCFDTAGGRVFMNIAMRYNRRRKHETD
jgi:CheY-specific phosphatase CheX